MTEPAAFAAAHKVIIDALSWLVAAHGIDPDRHPLILSVLADALPLAPRTGNRELDGLATAGSALVRAFRALQGTDPARGTDWCRANLDAGNALADFAWARLCRSSTTLFLPKNGVAK